MEDLYCSLFKISLQNQQQQQQNQKFHMDDLLRKIKKLSAEIKSDRPSEDSRSSKDDTSQPTSAKKVSRKRQKNRNKKHRGRKRQLKHIPDDVDSSSYTDLTDEDILRDYIENITANMNSSDTDITLRKGAFLVKRDFLSPLDLQIQCHAEVDETDSFSESLFLNHSKKKRRKHSRKNNDDGLDVLQMESDGMNKINHVIKQQFSRSNSTKKALVSSCKKIKLIKTCEFDEDVEMEEISLDHRMHNDASSDNHSETSTNSNSPGSEADDEGEESCVEHCVNNIKPVIPWWDQPNKNNMVSDDEMNIENSLSLIRGRCDISSSRYATKSNEPMQILVESGGFVAYANHKIKKFVQHRDSNELSLHTTNKKEQTQISKLATLYELHSIVEDNNKLCKVVLTKTSLTNDADQQALKLFLSQELKLRCRKSHPSTNWNPKKRKVSVAQHPEIMDIPIPEANLGHQMLRTMGWNPGQGLGKESSGITNPIKAVKRPKHLGFGHS